MSFTTSLPSLRDRQIATLEKMLHLNEPIVDNGSDIQAELTWKVLILDSRSTAIVSSVLRVNDLLSSGITMHSNIRSKRAALPDVPVIYFVEPNAENINFIIDDLERDQYAHFYINFTSSLNRDLLEEFAKKVATIGKSYKIKQVYDQYLDYIVTEPNLFSLDLVNIYSQLNNPNSLEDEINKVADKISNGIFAAILTMNGIPAIRCCRGGPAELIASKLDQKLRDHVINTKSSASFTNSKLVLILLDRNIDLASMFAHSWIYQCMVSDVFELKRNTIKIPSQKPNESTKEYDIDPKDFFWAANNSLPFPDAVEHVENELSRYKADAAELTRKTGVSSLQDIDPNAITDTTDIQLAVKSLPELAFRKSILDMHMKVLASLLQELESKSLDSYFEIEQNYKDPKNQKQFISILNNGNEHTLNDKLRTYIMLYLLTDLPGSFVEECEQYFKKNSAELGSLSYIKRAKEVIKLSNYELSMSIDASHSTTSGLVNEAQKSALFQGLSSKLYGLTDGGSRLTEGVGSLITGLKNLLPDKKQLPITNIVESIMEPSLATQESIKLTDDYLYFDPISTRGVHSKPPKRQQYNNSIVFVVGGGNYLEYQNLQEWVTKTNTSNVNGTKSVIYGSTSIVTANEFLKECSLLGAEAK
ncbi:hypothetical protein LJB42_001042 [Komagataella kurtzmanii]|nr:hypothetical protein LJB42_001042 [Komagataella kurtzmanii]